MGITAVLPLGCWKTAGLGSLSISCSLQSTGGDAVDLNTAVRGEVMLHLLSGLAKCTAIN